MQTSDNPAHYQFEKVPCYYCGSNKHSFFVTAQEDLTGKPGNFSFVTCSNCGLVYQNPRIKIDQIKYFYDSEYIAHRKKRDWGCLTPVYNWAMQKHDRDKTAIVQKYVKINSQHHLLDVGCAAGTFLSRMQTLYQCKATGVDFINLADHPDLENIDFIHGTFHELSMPTNHYDLITMWHFLEHDYHPLASLEKARQALSANGYLIIEVPRLDSKTFQLYRSRWPGLQAPQHTILFSKNSLLQFVQAAGMKTIAHLPYGAFPAYFYLFTGLAFTFLKGKGLNLNKWVGPYFAGQLFAAPLLLFERYLNLAMQTLICVKS